MIKAILAVLCVLALTFGCGGEPIPETNQLNRVTIGKATFTLGTGSIYHFARITDAETGVVCYVSERGISCVDLKLRQPCVEE